MRVSFSPARNEKLKALKEIRAFAVWFTEDHFI